LQWTPPAPTARWSRAGEIAQEPGGFRKEKRDFWHLYRMKKLPEETREYVPRVLAAAIVSRQAKKLGLEEP